MLLTPLMLYPCTIMPTGTVAVTPVEAVSAAVTLTAAPTAAHQIPGVGGD